VNDPRIIISLDFSRSAEALAFLQKIDPGYCRVKIGKELFTLAGPLFVDEVIKLGFDVFLDLKYHDIPTTVANACTAAADMGVWMINVHASGGKQMMTAAQAALSSRDNPPLLIAVTVLTSLNVSDLEDIGIMKSVEEQVLALAKLANRCGLDGVVRPEHSNHNDQSRIMTPTAAIRSGSDFLVIGRPITRSADPMQALRLINDEIRNVHGTS